MLIIGRSFTSPDEHNNSLLITNSSTSLYTNPIALHIPPGLLLPNNRYRFQLTLTDINGDQRYAKKDIITSSPPTSGQLFVSPLNGTSIITCFKLQAAHWTDEHGDTPLYYRYGYMYTNNNTVIWLTGITEDDNHVTFLPVSTVNVMLQIYDKNGARTLVAQPVNVLPSQGPIDLMNLYDNLYVLIVNQNRWREGLSNLIAILSSIGCDVNNNGAFSEAYMIVFKQQSIELVENFLSFSPLIKKDSLSLVLTIYELCLCEEGIQQLIANDSITLILKGLETIISSYVTYSKDTFFINKGITSEEAQQIINIYDKLGQLSNIAVNYNRITVNPIYSSYKRVLSDLGYGLCQYSGLHESSILITSLHFGTLKVYHSIPPRQYNISCSSSNISGDNKCPFLMSNVVMFGQVIFAEYIKNFCTQTNALGNFTSCEGTCIISSQLKYDIHWSGDPYSHHIKTNPIIVEFRSPDQHNMSLYLPLTVNLLLIANASSSGAIECVYWNDSKWINNDCNTNIVRVNLYCIYM